MPQFFSTNSQIKQFATQKHVFEFQQTVFEKPADSFKRAWFTLPDSFKIIRNPCQTVLNFFGFLFSPDHIIILTSQSHIGIQRNEVI